MRRTRRSDDLLRALSGRVPLDYVFLAERSRVVYMRVPKAACTTMLWTLMELEGHDPESMDRSLKPLLSTPDVLVHDMNFYPLPTLKTASPALIDEALTSSEWLRVAVVRNPYARLYSAWESKILLGPPKNMRFSGAPPLVEVEGGVDVGASFRAFVRVFERDSRRWLSEKHFGLQLDLIPVDILDGIELVPTSDIPHLLKRLSMRTGMTFGSHRSNEGLGFDGTKFLDDQTAEIIRKIYAKDFELTGSDPDGFTPGDPVVLDPVALRLIRIAGARNDRTVLLSNAYKEIVGRSLRARTQRVADTVRRQATAASVKRLLVRHIPDRVLRRLARHR